MKILIFGLGGVFGASRREHVEHVEHMNGIIDEDQTKELRVSFLIPSTFILPDCPLSFCRTVHFHLNPMSLKNTPKNKRFLLVPYTFKNYGSVLLSESDVPSTFTSTQWLELHDPWSIFKPDF